MGRSASESSEPVGEPQQPSWNRNDIDDQIVIHLPLPLELSAQEIVNAAVESGLCSPCRDAIKSGLADLDDRDNPYRHEVRIWYQPLLSHLSVMIKHCFICCSLFANTPRSSQLALGQADKNTDVQVVVTMSGVPTTSLPLHIASWSMVINGVRLWHARFGHVLAMVHQRPRDLVVPGNGSTSTNSRVSRETAIRWFEECKANVDGYHDGCWQHHDVNFVPTRLLDVHHAQRTGLLRVTNSWAFNRPADEGMGQFITLSHCWGSGKNPLLLLENLDQRTNTGWPLEELPQTFQDALQITSWFGVRWLWIDCLCIIQDSPGGEDWLREAQQMQHIYANATLNISADVGSNSHVGCFVNREAVTTVRPLVSQNNKTWMLRRCPEDGNINDAPSSSRAWIWRERQLSRRILHFTAQELYWECCTSNEDQVLLSESMPWGIPLDGYTISRRDRFRAVTQQPYLPGLHEQWKRLCEQLSNTNLTKRSDLAVILSSIAEEFSKILPSDRYIAGHWQSRLIRSLLWQRYPTLSPGVEVEEQHAVAPTWSWLACRSGFYQHFPRHGPYCADLVDVSVQLLKPDFPFGPVTHKALDNAPYQGPWRRATVCLDACGPLRASGSQASSDKSLDCFFLFVEGVNEGLLLRRTSPEWVTPKTYSRLGLLSLPDEGGLNWALCYSMTTPIPIDTLAALYKEHGKEARQYVRLFYGREGTWDNYTLEERFYLGLSWVEDAFRAKGLPRPERLKPQLLKLI
ncbi:heterokaryon incompatibility protein-domain-containing protein [Xylariaceae sp. FL0804]|nr:heterokaryon incompatibility protein-domain-containing protein [Xylariaceae sp. FL0804]